MTIIIELLDYIGTAIFAITGALSAGRKRMDIFGVVVLGCVTALGGGTLRDVILGIHPIFWISNTVYLIVATIAAIGTFFLSRHGVRHQSVLLYGDAVGLATFTVIGFRQGFEATQLYSIGIIMGVMTGVAGGMIRDILSGEIPLILRQEIYASASLCGASLFALLLHLDMPDTFIALITVGVTLLIRLSAIRWNLSLPVMWLEKETHELPVDKQKNTSNTKRHNT